MRRILPISLLALVLTGGVASADRWRDREWRTDRRGQVWHNHGNAHGGVVVRDHRRPVYRERYYGDRYRDRARYVRRPVYVNNGRFVFRDGFSRRYVRPVIRQRYFDYRYRPQIIVEHHDPVPGYIWVQGHWNWNGYEWIWVSGHFAPDPSYQYDYNSSYNYDYNYNQNYNYNYNY